MMDFLKKLIKKLKPKCPCCGGIMDVAFIDMEINKMVYKCRNCGKEWV